MKLIGTIKARTLALIAVLLVFVVVASAVVGSENIPSYAEKRKIPIYSVETSDAKVALTFDAAWGADKTSKIMDILDRYGVKGTFFLVGFWVDNYPEKVKEIYDRGHLIGNHSTNHPQMSKLSEEEIAQEITTTAEKIHNITGEYPAYFRPPFGDYSNELITYNESQNIQTIQWSIDTLDWKGLSGGKIADRVMSTVQNGSIILAHNNSDHILEALPIILEGLQNKGITAVRIDELVYKSDYHIDSTGKQIKNT